MLQLQKRLRKQSAISRQTHTTKSGNAMLLSNQVSNANRQLKMRGKSAKIRGGLSSLKYMNNDIQGQQQNFVNME